MAEEADQSEKTEPPSPFKLREAKNKGSVSKSNEVNAAVAIIAGLFLVLAIGTLFVRRVLSVSAGILVQAGQLQFTPQALTHFLSRWTVEAMVVISPIVAVMFIVGVLSTIVQTGFVFSTFPLKPDFTRLNPVSGLKKFLNIAIIYEVVKSLLKISAFVAVAAWTIMGNLNHIMQAWSRSVPGLLPFFLDLAVILLFRLAVLIIVFAIVDILFTRWQFLKKMRMTRKELKDEVKRREGDPMVRAKRRELEKELRQRSQSVSSVPNADLIVTNPDHYAVVLQYDRHKMAAPCVTGKGSDEMARVIRREAHKYGVPVISSPPLARALYRRVKVGHVIGREFFVDVAKVLRRAYRERHAQIVG